MNSFTLSPLAQFFGVVPNYGVHLLARLGTPDGSRVLEASAEGEDPVQVGEVVAGELNAQGAAELLAMIPKPEGD